jgi:uncharacterized protein
MGGVTLGLGTLSLIFFNGKVAGISGTIKGALKPEKKFPLAGHFLLGLVIGGGLSVTFFKEQTALGFTANTVVIVAAGLLVGIGTGIGGGCTSGHGICGMARTSKHSITATCVFVGVGVVTHYFVRHIWGLCESPFCLSFGTNFLLSSMNARGRASPIE